MHWGNRLMNIILILHVFLHCHWCHCVLHCFLQHFYCFHASTVLVQWLLESKYRLESKIVLFTLQSNVALRHCDWSSQCLTGGLCITAKVEPSFLAGGLWTGNNKQTSFKGMTGLCFFMQGYFWSEHCLNGMKTNFIVLSQDDADQSFFSCFVL